ncbi:hypothetical protein oki361_16630 [Helicobacter pylori]
MLLADRDNSSLSNKSKEEKIKAYEDSNLSYIKDFAKQYKNIK